MAFRDTIEQIQAIDLSDIDRIGVWPLVVRIALWLLAMVLIFVATYFVFIKDLNLQLESAERKEAQLRQAFETKAHEAQNLEEYRAQMVVLGEQLRGLVSQLPTETEEPGLLEDIAEVGRRSGLDITKTDFQSEVVGEIYIERPIQLSARGGYHEFGAFVSGLAGMPRIVTLHNFKLTADTSGRLLTMNIGAKTYRYKAQE